MGRLSPVVAVLVLVCLLCTSAVHGQTTVGLCYTAYSNVIDFGTTAGAWASQLAVTLTLNTSLPLGPGFPAAATVTAVSGQRITASSDGLGRIVSTVSVSLVSVAACAGLVGCDNVFYYPPLAPNADYFDSQGLAMALSSVQTDTDQCITSAITIKAGNITYCDGGATLALYNTLQIYTQASQLTTACTPPVAVAPPYTCGVGTYNFSALASLPDISGVFGGYTMYVRVCGAVSQPDCVRSFGTNVMVCQWGSPGAQYVEAINNSPVGETQFFYQNGVDGAAGIGFYVRDGQYCSAASSQRNFTGLLVCGNTNSIIFYNETATCNYVMTISTPLACPQTQTFGMCAIMTTTSGPRVVTYNNCQPHHPLPHWRPDCG